VLLTSSLTVVLSIVAIQRADRRTTMMLLWATVGSGSRSW